MQTLILTV